MYKIKVLTVGKNKDTWLSEGVDEYLTRMSSIAQFEFVYLKDDHQLLRAVEQEQNVVCLDPLGRSMTSELFSDYLHQRLLEGGSRLTFVIGGAEGLPKVCRSRYPLLSFSNMTYTHQMVRLLLVEQVYRAFEISKGTGYHK